MRLLLPVALFGWVLLGACSPSGAEAPGATVELVQQPTRTPVPPATPTPTPTPTATPVPPPELIVSTTQVYQGGAILASVPGLVASGEARWLGRTYPLTRGEHAYYAFLSVGPIDPVGAFEVAVRVTMEDGTEMEFTQVVTVLSTAWEVDYLEITGEQTQLLAPSIVAAERELLTQMYATYSAERLWDGPWVLPLEGRLTSRFGQQRSFNNGPPSGHHGGTDIGAPEGTPIVATNSGVVIMARALDVRGNFVVIDHGGGLLSGYGHMSSWVVAEGQMVEAGELIGYVGSTGLSTGPHLHWEMASNGILIDGYRFVDGSNGF